ncbi:actin binding protein [Coemansia sp. RSA 1972]|nr:actin binding protein [Coemansia sp. RSA 1972]
MSNLDLSAHASEISSTHQRILSNAADISWALYGFDRGSNALNVQARGSDGLEELAEEFDDGKVQFAFARVLDPNTRLSKFVFISWCGQGVPVFRKGLVGSQVGEVQRVLTGYHVSVVARTEADVQADEIMDQVARSSGAQYSYHTKPKAEKPAVAAKPTFGSQTAFRKGGSYGAPTVTKDPEWEAAAAAMSPPISASKINQSFGAGSSRPASSMYSGRAPTSSVPPAYKSQQQQQNEPAATSAGLSPAYRSQQDERQAELEALRRGSRAPSQASVSRGATPTLVTPARVGAQTPTEPSSHVSQADQTKNELDMLRNRRLLNSGLGASSGTGHGPSPVSERNAELDAIRRARSGSQTSFQAASQPPVHSWTQRASQDDGAQKREQELQRQREEEARRREQELQTQREEEARRREQELQQQRDDEERRREQKLQMQRNEEAQRHELELQRQREDEERRREQQQLLQKQREEDERQQALQRQREEEAQKQREAEMQQHHQNQESGSRGQRARAVYDYDATADDELGFREGEIVYNVEQLDPGWWAAESKDGTRQGVFPSNFVELIDDDAPPSPSVASVPAAPPPFGGSAPRAPPLPGVSAPPAPPLPGFSAPLAPPLPPLGGGIPPPPPPLPGRSSSPAAPALPVRSNPTSPPPAPPLPPAPALPPVAPPLPPAPALPPMHSQNDSPPPALPPRGGSGPISPAAPPMAPPLPQAPAQAQNDMGENYAVAMFEYVAAEEGELSFEEGEYVTHIEFLSDDWWEGANKHGEFGLFPATFVKLQT